MHRLTWWKILAFKELVKRGYSVRVALALTGLGRSTYVKYYDLIWDDQLREHYYRSLFARAGVPYPSWNLDIPKSKPEDLQRRAERLINLYKDFYKNVHRKPINQ
jgi:hypothetical protein